MNKLFSGSRFILLTCALLVVSAFFVPTIANAIGVATITSLNLTAPIGGELWRGMQDIAWTATTNPVGGGNNISILISTNGGASYNTLVSSILSSDSTYSWDTTTSGAGPLADGNNYRIKIWDSATGLDSLSASNFTVDNTAPTTTYTPSFAPDGITGWYNIATGVPTITLTCVDGVIGSGCNKIYYQWDGTTGSWTDYAVTPFLALEGDHTLYYYSDDNATDNLGVRNEEIVKSQQIKVDTVAPTAPAITSIADDNYINDSEKSAVHVVGTAEADSTVSVALTDTFPTSITNTGTADSFGNFDIIIDASTLLDGTITPTVNATDAAGNTGANTTTPTAIKDVVAVISSITSNATGVGVLKIGDTILFTMTPSTTENGATVSGSYNGNDLSWSTSNGGATYTATYTVTEGESDQTLPLQITGVTYTDVAGNTSAPADGSDVAKTIDANRPILSSVTIISDNINPVWAKTGDTVTLSFVANENLSGTPVVTISGASAVVAGGGATWSATYTMLVTDTEGVIPFTIDFSDVATNTGVQVTSITSGSDVTFDRTAPLAPVITSIADDNYINDSEKSAVHVVGTAEADSTVSVILTDSGATSLPPVTGVATGGSYDIVVDASTLVDGTITPTVSATDAAGNTSAKTTTPTAIKDVVAPTVFSITTKDNNTDGSVETATIVFTESVKDSTFGTGSDFSIGGVAVTTFTTGTADDATVDISNGGVAGTEKKTVAYTPGSATDLAGNPVALFSQISTDSAGPIMLSAKTTSTTTIDTTWSENIKDATVNSSCSEFDVSGYVCSAASESAGIVTITVATMPTDATPVITFTNVDNFKDLNDNQAPTPQTTTATDEVAPVLTAVSIVSNNVLDTTLAKAGDKVTLTFTSSEAIATPVVTIVGQSASVTGGSTGWTATRIMDIRDTQGNVAFSIDFKDVSPAENVGTTVTAVTDGSAVFYDSVNPSVDAGADKEVNAVANQNATVSDGGSGILSYLWTNETPTVGIITFGTPGAEDTTISADTDGTYTIRLTVTDNAGNVAFDEITFIWDTTEPTINTSTPSDGSTGISIASGTATVVFDEDVVLLNASRVLFVNDVTGDSYKSAVSVSGGNEASAVLNVDYSGLAYGTKYRINVKPNAVSDVAGNNFEDGKIFYFTTEIDRIAPVVNLANASGITTTGATLNVTTDENANCRYAISDSAYSSMAPFLTTGTTTHNVVLTGLSSSTGYDYSIRCADTTAQANTMTTSARISFTTLTPSDTTAPAVPVITTASTTIDADNYTIAGTVANDGGNRIVSVYNGATLVGTASVPAGATAWSLLVSLNQETVNTFSATATDAVGNVSTSSSPVTITEATAVGDTTAPATPVISTAPATTDADTYTIAGTAGADLPTDGARTITIYNNGIVMGSIVLLTGETDWSFVASLNQNTGNTFTAYSTDQANNTSLVSNTVVITETTSADTTAPATPVITTGATTVDADTYTIAGTAGADLPTDGSRTITIYNNGIVMGSIVLLTGETDWSFVASLNQNAGNTFTAYSTDQAGITSSVSNSVVITEVTSVVDDSTVTTVSVTGISAVKTYATADGSYANGWEWTFNVTVPTLETQLQMKFADWVSSLNTIEVANNIRYSSAQASNGPFEITAASTYGGALSLTGDLDSGSAGRQIQIKVEARVPVGSEGGSYSTSYGIQSNPEAD